MSVNPSPVAPSGEAEANPHPLPRPALPSDVMHRTKVVDFFGRRTPIVCQDRNGPCPLFAICNLFSLKGAIALDSDAGEVSEQKLLSIVDNCLKTININQEMDEVSARTREQDVKNVLDLLPRLPTGIFMNMILTKIDAFEWTTERVLFKLLGIPLYHGYIVDPKDIETAAAIGSKSFDTLNIGLAKLKSLLAEEDELTRAVQLSLTESGDGELTTEISHSQPSSTNLLLQSEENADHADLADITKESTQSEKALEWKLIENFLQTNSAQLTAYGLFCLHEDLKESELCVLFRNNHFSTMFKHEGSLYMLANDVGLIKEGDVVWEKYDKLNGGGVYMTSKFIPWKKEEAVMSIDSFARSEKTSGEIPLAVPTDDVISDMLNVQYLSGGSKLLTYSASVANALVVRKDWEGLDDYLGKFVANVLKKTPNEVVMMHPGLFFYPRMERLLDMLSDKKFDEADYFYQNSIELFRGCQGRFVPLDLVRSIDDLYTGVRLRDAVTAKSRSTNEETATRISDYIHLYFPSAIRRDDGLADGVWQFAMRLPKPDKQGSYYGFRCLLCGWDHIKGSYSLSHLKSHFLQSKELRSCPRVTEDTLDRLRAIDDTKDLPTFEDIKAKFGSKRRSKFGYIITWVPTVTTSSTEPSTNQTGKGKRPRDNSLSFGSPMSKLRHHPLLTLPGHSVGTPTIPLNTQMLVPPPSTSAPITNSLNMITSGMNVEVAALLGHVTPAVVPDSGDRSSITGAVIAMQHLVMRLCRYARANHPEPDLLSSIMASLDKASVSVHQRIDAAALPSNDDREFLLRKVASLNQMMLGIYTSPEFDSM